MGWGGDDTLKKYKLDALTVMADKCCNVGVALRMMERPEKGKKICLKDNPLLEGNTLYAECVGAAYFPTVMCRFPATLLTYM